MFAHAVSPYTVPVDEDGQEQGHEHVAAVWREVVALGDHRLQNLEPRPQDAALQCTAMCICAGRVFVGVGTTESCVRNE